MKRRQIRLRPQRRSEPDLTRLAAAIQALAETISQPAAPATGEVTKTTRPRRSAA